MSVIAGVGAAFVQSVLPVLLIGGLGYLVGRARAIDLAPITGLTVLVLVPAIVFDSLARATLPRDLLSRLVLHVALQLRGHLVGHGRRGTPGRVARAGAGAFLLATLFSNSGNVGLPLSLFAFGPGGLAIAGGWFAVMSIGAATIAPYLAARSRVGARAALGRVGRQPVVYAVVAGIIANLAGWSLPGPVAKASSCLPAAPWPSCSCSWASSWPGWRCGKRSSGEAAERAHAAHQNHCPVARTLRGAVGITTELSLEVEA